MFLNKLLGICLERKNSRNIHKNTVENIVFSIQKGHRSSKRVSLHLLLYLFCVCLTEKKKNHKKFFVQTPVLCFPVLSIILKTYQR